MQPSLTVFKNRKQKKNKHPIIKTIKKNIIYSKLKVIIYLVLANYKDFSEGDLFGDVKTFCLFIGQGRSGHTIFGALLDAHPNVILSDEANSLMYLTAGLNRRKIFHVLLMKSQRQAKRKRVKGGLGEKIYSYWVPGQWQGRYEKLQVIGDCKGGATVHALEQNPTLLDQFHDTINADLKFIHVVRNPYDNISTMALRRDSNLEGPINDYFNNDCQALAVVRPQINPEDLLTVRHEDLIFHPEDTLKRVIQFIGLEPIEDYINDCANIIYKSTSKTRHKIDWDAHSIELVKQNMDQFDFLAGYSYSDE